MAQPERVKVEKYQGVYYRESSSKKWQGKKDRCYDILFRDRYGRQRWEKIGWSSEGYTAAKAALIRGERVQAVRHGRELPSEKRDTTIGQAWENYSNELKSGSIATYLTYNSFFNKYLKAYENHYLSELEGLVPKIRTAMADLAPGTIQTMLAVFQRMVSVAIRTKLYAGDNPFREIKRPKVENKRMRFLSKEEAEAVLEEARKVSEDLYGACLISLQTGMRLKEVLTLKPVHIDLEHGLINVVDTKSKNRTVYITPAVREYIEPRMSRRTGIVLLSKNNVWYGFTKIISGMGLNKGVTDNRFKVVFHSLRHTFASWLAMEGTPLQVIMELMGHSDLKMTLRYAHLIPDTKSAAVMRLFAA